MRNLIVLMLALPLPALASTTVEVLVKHKYSEQSTRLYQKGAAWLCDTELQKGIKLRGPAEAPPLFPKKEGKSEACRSLVTAVMEKDGKLSKWRGCSDGEEAKSFLKALNRECAR